MSRWTAWLSAVALLAGAWLVAWITPDGDGGYREPFAVPATIGEPAVARNLGVTIRDLALADRVQSGGWGADGTWLVVTLDAWVVQNETEAQIREAFLTVGGRTFRASERPGNYSESASLFRTGLSLDLPRSGAIAFELPDDAVTGRSAETAMLQLAFGNGAVSEQSAHALLLTDAVIELPVNLDTIPRIDVMELPATEWAAR
ncbi:MAG: hypothetical protein P0Y48_10245 [Candidatus Microbacterium phytovorans]|uniref:Uncharacterized protein n=1 Tax=Candidatus Microbacterium phytovorans TaxID=3121374 RepID=A0AAJ5W1D2_9MICO|nr:hypothetical protein [Microbacterium sp.]WEK12841.1 MAG: hypothetical protein P0Y48_10245 [Microbacterium sp.]